MCTRLQGHAISMPDISIRDQTLRLKKYVLLKFLLSYHGLCLRFCAYACAYVDACAARFIAFHFFAFDSLRLSLCLCLYRK